MAKKVKFESLIFHFLTEAKKIAEEYDSSSNSEYFNKWKYFIYSLEFENISKDHVIISWEYPEINKTVVDVSKAVLYLRGDNQKFIQKQKNLGIDIEKKDIIKLQNKNFFRQLVIDVSKLANLNIS